MGNSNYTHMDKEPVETTAVELTEDERMSRASKEVADILKKYSCTITVQNVPVIMPAKQDASTDLKA